MTVIPAVSQLYRYIFYRLNRQVRRKLSDESEAAWTALLYMSSSLMAIVVMVDVLSARALGAPLVMERLGKWQYGILVFGVICWLNYQRLGKQAQVANINREFDRSNVYGRWGTWLVAAYLLLPYVALLGVVAMLR